MPKDIPISKDLTNNKDTQKAVRHILTQWAGELSDQDGLRFGDQVELVNITSHPVFFGKLETLYEARGAYEKEAPLASNEHLTPQMIYQISQVDPWALHVADHREFTPFKRDYVVPGSAVLVPCPTCHGEEHVCARCGGAKMIDCHDCHGQGLDECPTCGASGHKACPDCDGKGFLFCPHCSGSGTTTRQETELSKEGVVENIKTVSQPCVKCGGSGKVECRKCGSVGSIRCTTCQGKKYSPCESCRGTGKTFCPDCREEVSGCTTCHGTGKVKRQFVVRQQFIPQVERVIDVDDNLDVFRRFYESLGRAHATLLVEHTDTALPLDMLVDTPLDSWYTEALSAMNSGDHVEVDDDIRIKLQSLEVAYITALEVSFIFEERAYTYLVRMDTEKVFIQQNPEEKTHDAVQDNTEVYGNVAVADSDSAGVATAEGAAVTGGALEAGVGAGAGSGAPTIDAGIGNTNATAHGTAGAGTDETEVHQKKKSRDILDTKVQLWTGKGVAAFVGALVFGLLFDKPIFILPFVRASYAEALWAQMAYPWILAIIVIFWILLGRGGAERYQGIAKDYKALRFEALRGAAIIGITAVVSTTGLLYGIVRLLYGFVQLFV